MNYNNTKNINIQINAKDNATPGIKKIEHNLKGLANRVKNTFASLGQYATAFLAGIGGLSINAGMKLDKALGNVSTLIDTSKENIKKLEKEILNLGKESAQPTQDLADALYDIRSAGVSAENELEALKAASDLATAGLGTTKTAANILTSAINTFGQQGYSAHQIANILFKTIKNGKTTIEGLSQGFGGVASVAVQAGIDFKEFAAAVAALTTTGLSASEVYTGLKGIITSVLKPTTEATKLAKKLGLDFDASAIKSKGFIKFLEDVKEKTQGDSAQLSILFGSVEGLNSVLGLIGTKHKTFLKDLEDNKSKVDELAIAVAKQNKTFAAQWQMLKNKLLPILIQIFDILAPILTKINNFITKNPELTKKIIILVGVLTSLLSVLGIIGVVIGPLTVGFSVLSGAIAAVGAVLGAIGAPILLVITGITVLIGVIYHFRKSIIKGIGEAYKYIKNKFLSLVSFLGGLKTSFLNIGKNIVKNIVAGIKSIGNEIKNTILSFIPSLDSIKGAIKGGISGLKSVGSSIGNFITGKRELGGTVLGNNSYLVGENGPEIFIPNTTGTIKNKIGGDVSFSVNINSINVYNEADEDRLINKIKQELIRQKELYNLGIL